MTELTLNIGGLVAYVLDRSNKRCDALLLDAGAHAGPAHEKHGDTEIQPHLPVLVVPRQSVKEPPKNLPQIILDGRVDPKWKELPQNLQDYVAWQLSRSTIIIAGARDNNLKFAPPTRTGSGEVPQNEDWSDLKWLVSMQRVVQDLKFNVKASEDSPSVIARFRMVDGAIKGRSPLDDVKADRRLAHVGPLRQATTDSIVYSYSKDPIAIVVTGSYGGEIVLNSGKVEAFLLNLPDKMFQGNPSQFGQHFNAYYQLPFDPPAMADGGPWPGPAKQSGPPMMGGSQCMGALIEI